MKIVILTNSDAGLYLFRKELLEALIAAGHSVTVSVPAGLYSKDLKSLGCRLVTTDFDRRGKNPFRELWLLHTYKKLIKELAPDLVLTYTIKPNIYGGLACASARRPYLANITGLGTEIEGAGPGAKLLLGLYRFAVRKARRVFVQNETIDAVFEAKKIARGRRTVIPGSGVNLERHPYLEYPAPGDRTRFLFIGRIMKDKGIEELLGAIAALAVKHPEISFELVGDFEDGTYQKRIEELEKQGVLAFSGYQKDVNEPLAHAHALINPSYHEGISNVLLEASATGRPVLATLVPGCRETFTDGVTGIGFEARSTDALIDAVERFLALSYDERKQMGKAGREKMEREFDRRIVIDAYLGEISALQKEKGSNE